MLYLVETVPGDGVVRGPVPDGVHQDGVDQRKQRKGRDDDQPQYPDAAGDEYRPRAPEPSPGHPQLGQLHPKPALNLRVNRKAG